jgi:hypothetical protein
MRRITRICVERHVLPYSPSRYLFINFFFLINNLQYLQYLQYLLYLLYFQTLHILLILHILNLYFLSNHIKV